MSQFTPVHEQVAMLQKMHFGKIRKFLQKNISRPLLHLMSVNCLLCGAESTHLTCQGCVDHFFSPTRKRCISCALPVFIHDTRCGKCVKKPPAFDTTTVACDYLPPLDQLVLGLKFAHRLPLATAMGELLGRAALRAFNDETLPELLIAVPLSKERLIQRSFNQSVEIAKPVAQLVDRPLYFNLLQRVRDTEAQTLLQPKERHENIRRAFAPNERYADKIRGRHIGVIDDVITTGATLNEVAACLKQHGAARVSNIVFARTLPH